MIDLFFVPRVIYAVPMLILPLFIRKVYTNMRSITTTGKGHRWRICIVVSREFSEPPSRVVNAIVRPIYAVGSLGLILVASANE